MSIPAHVVWTIRAKRCLRQALVRQEVQSVQVIDPPAVMTHLNQILTRAFPNAQDLIVHDQYLGFRLRDGEYILQVEVHDPDRPGHYVVKVKDPEALATELRAWQECRPEGLRHDLVFMTLDPVRAKNGRLQALRYQDAQQFISVDRTVSLEEAFLAAVMHGAPTPDSLGNVLTELYARVGHLLYRAARPVQPKGKTVPFPDGKELGQFLTPWQHGGGPRNARRIVIAALPLGQESFFDPVTFYEFLLGQLQDRRPAKELVPRMLRGQAHGDLHGRNVLVGLIENEAHWPAVFDYEHMGKDHWLGWDFVKMETELKIRAYPLVFAGKKLLDFAGTVCAFETALAEATEHHRREGDWPGPAGTAPQERLRNLLLGLRRLAGKHLGEAHKRPEEWLEEYYFLLGCYGVYAGKFDNLKENELMAAFLSAGLATARFSYSRSQRMSENGDRTSKITGPVPVFGQ
jgi:hypothetical protein